MGISSISSASSMMSFQDLQAPASTQTSVNKLVSQLEGSISSGDLKSTRTILQSIKAIAPPDTGIPSALSTFLTSVSTAVKDNSTSEAEAALDTYKVAITQPSDSSGISSAEKSAIGEQLMEDKLTLSVVKESLDSQNTTTTSSSSSSTGTTSSSTSTDSIDSSSFSSSSQTSNNYATGSFYSAAA